jgi:hypothetical protein
VQVHRIFLCFLNTPCFEILLLPLFWRGSCFTLFSMLFDRSTCFPYASWAYSFFNDPSLLLQEYKKGNLFELWSIYFWGMDDMFCVTPGVGVSMYMWVYVISIMDAWKDSTKGHNNLEKTQWVTSKHMEGLCIDIDIWLWSVIWPSMNLPCFIFKKKSSEISPYFEIEQIDIVTPYHTSQQPRFGHKYLLPTKFYFRLLSQNIPTNSKMHIAQGYALGSCKVLI